MHKAARVVDNFDRGVVASENHVRLYLCRGGEASMMNDHLVDFVVADEKVLVSDGVIRRGIAVQGIGTSRPQVSSYHVQVRDLLSVTCVELKEVFASLGNSLDLRTDCHKDCCLVLGAADDDAGDVVRKRLRRLVALDKFTLLVFPVFQSAQVSNHD